MQMQFYTLDPLQDRRWDELIASHPRASVFHHTGWLKALAITYSYRPVVITTTPPGTPLRDGLVFCEVESWITGRRLISVPFADHSEPLLNGCADALKLAEWAQTEIRERRWRYIELRPLSAEMRPGLPMVASHTFWFHTLDLTPSLDQILHNFHKSCVQRRIRHAEREQLSYERGCSDDLLNDFYRLLIVTRRRHRLLPQPRAWFHNLVASMSPNVEIRIARKAGNPIAAIMTLRHRRIVVYKYGCSDETFHHLSGMPFLFGRLVVESKTEGAEGIDFGRTDTDNPGLADFKDRLGTDRRRLVYYRYAPEMRGASLCKPVLFAAQALASALPGALSSAMGRVVYRHIA